MLIVAQRWPLIFWTKTATWRASLWSGFGFSSHFSFWVTSSYGTDGRTDRRTGKTRIAACQDAGRTMRKAVMLSVITWTRRAGCSVEHFADWQNAALSQLEVSCFQVTNQLTADARQRLLRLEGARCYHWLADRQWWRSPGATTGRRACCSDHGGPRPCSRRHGRSRPATWCMTSDNRRHFSSIIFVDPFTTSWHCRTLTT